MNFNSLLQRRWVHVVVAVGMLAAVWVAAWMLQGPSASRVLNVPLGVEQAAIVTYSGSPIKVPAYQWGVAVSVRIAKVTPSGEASIYDVRYIVNRAGTFDLKDYLSGEDGASLAGLPSFKFQGDPKLSKQLEARIQETEQMSVDVGVHYHATLAALAVAWILCLLPLIFAGRTRKQAPEVAVLPQETFTQFLQGCVLEIEAGTLDTEGMAKLEMQLLEHWRGQLALDRAPMTGLLWAIDRDPAAGPVLRQLQDWLHNPSSKTSPLSVATALKPYASDETPPRAVASHP